VASLVLNDAHVTINAVDLSAFVRSVTIEASRETVEDTAMGDSARTFIASYRNWTMTFEFNQDFAALATDVTLWPIFDAGSAVALVVRPVKATAIGTTNPEYRGSGVMDDFPPIQGAVGQLATTRARFRSAGTLTRNTV
jgi:hypothetical protein